MTAGPVNGVAIEFLHKGQRAGAEVAVHFRVVGVAHLPHRAIEFEFLDRTRSANIFSRSS